MLQNRKQAHNILGDIVYLLIITKNNHYENKTGFTRKWRHASTKETTRKAMKQTLIWLTKYYPIVSSLNIFGLMILDLFNIDINGITGYIVGCTLWSTITFFCLSYFFFFCTWNRVLLLNAFMYSILGVLSKFGVYAPFFAYVIILTTICCIIVATILYYRYGCFDTRQSKESFAKVSKGHRLRGVQSNVGARTTAANRNVGKLHSRIHKSSQI